jgi:MFS family permease
MYSQTDLDEAVAAGALSADAASALRNFVATQRETPAADEEQFRLLTGFNDIFVSIAAVMLLSAVGFIGQLIGPQIEQNGPSPLAGVLVAATAWGLALFFTAKRRMALPSIILLLAFVGGVLFASGTGIAMIVGQERLENSPQMMGMLGAVSAAIAAAAAWFHWKRFRVPITVAAGAAAVAGIAMGALVGVLGDVANIREIMLGFMLLLGVGIFFVAMRWDSSDPARVTRRSDVAFWLHLLAAPMIVHPIFALLGLTSGGGSILDGVIVILLYVSLGVTALAIDRRALLVSALAYVLWALSNLFERFGAVQFNVALTALVIGSALLLLSAFWHQARAAIVRPLPENLRARLPLVAERVSPAPAA